jgi:hypothetical protein
MAATYLLASSTPQIFNCVEVYHAVSTDANRILGNTAYNFREFMIKKWVVPSATLLCVSAGIFAFLLCYRRLPTALDPATPRHQNVFALQDYSLTERKPPSLARNAFEVFLQTYVFRTQFNGITAPGLLISASDSAKFQDCRFFASASNGDTFPLGWYGSSSGYFVRLPAGYPDNYKWLDILAKDKSGPQASWRFRELPHLNHKVVPGSGSPIASVAGIRIESRAWWDPPSRKYPGSPIGGSSNTPALYTELRAPMPISQKNTDFKSHWEVRTTNVEPEWQPSPVGNSISSYITRSSGGGGSRYGYGSKYMTASADLYPHPCAAAQTVVRVQGDVKKVAEDREILVLTSLLLKRSGKGFIPLQPENTFRTKSGILVKVHQPDSHALTEPLSPNEIRFAIELPQMTSGNGVVLPTSPLYRRYRKPVQLSTSIDWDEGIMSSILNSSDEYQAVNFREPLTRLKMPRLTLTVTQKVELTKIPFALVVPVKKGHPAERWDRD